MRQSLFQNTFSLFYITKGLLGRVLMEHEGKDRGDELPVSFWKELYVDTWLMHMKVDVTAKELGITLISRVGLVVPQCVPS